jgi:cell division protein FtsN
MIQLIFLITFSYFASADRCLALLDAFKVEQAQTEFHQLQNDGSEKYRFLAAYFTRDASEANVVFESLYQSAKSDDIKSRSQQKLYEYYYALGYYVKAEGLKPEANASSTTSIVNTGFAPSKKELLMLQCGVFSAESNAQLLKEKIATEIDTKVYLTRDYLNDQTVFRVIVGNFSTYAEAEKVKLTLKQKLGIHAFVKTEN